MLTPIRYIPNFIPYADEAVTSLWEGLSWQRRETTPRFEYYCNRFHRPYVYGRGAGMREYHPQEWHPMIERLHADAEREAACTFEVNFLNGYKDGSDQLGWHADDSPEMDDARPIAIISLGAEREIWFKPQGAGHESVEKLVLGHGSLCLMQPGMQDTHWHRIPKAGRIVGPRISLTMRGYVAMPME